MTSSVIDLLKEILFISAVTFFTVLAASVVLVGIAIVLHDRHLK
jgi:hypothetical protein